MERRGWGWASQLQIGSLKAIFAKKAVKFSYQYRKDCVVKYTVIWLPGAAAKLNLEDGICNTLLTTENFAAAVKLRHLIFNSILKFHIPQI